MSDAFCKIDWPGVPHTLRWQFTFSPGIQPSTCVITSKVAGVNPAHFGTLTLLYNDGRGNEYGIAFPNCVLEAPPYQSGENGASVRMPIKDRRIWWQFGAISGAYNQREPDDSLVREKTPQQLATLLLESMRERDYDVSQLPAEPRPAVKWNHANPAQELDRLCQLLGCIVVLNPLTNRVEIWREGKGQQLPDLPTIGRSIGFSRLATPEILRLVGQPTLFQGAFYSATPVGEDTDGSIKPIDELSYKPADGWENTHPSMYAIDGTYERYGETKNLRDLALSCVWKWYKIEYQINPNRSWSPELLKGTELESQSLADLELFSTLVETVEQPDGTKQKLPAQCYIKSWQGGDRDENNTEYARLKDSYTIDSKAGIIRFGSQQYKLTDGGQAAADVVLVTSYYAGRDGKRHAFTREIPIQGGRPGSGPLVLREALQQTYVDKVKFENGQRDGIENNDTELNEQADAFLVQHVERFRLQDAPVATYKGLVTGSLDGRIQQITWASGEGGTTTTVSAGSRHNPYVRTLEDIRRQREAEQVADFILGQQKVDAAKLLEVAQ